MEKKIWIKQTKTKKGRIIEGHYRKVQVSTFKKGYDKAYREIYDKFLEIDDEEKRYYWRWNLLGAWMLNKTLHNKEYENPEEEAEVSLYGDLPLEEKTR